MSIKILASASWMKVTFKKLRITFSRLLRLTEQT
jgi:hypothetical protein